MHAVTEMGNGWSPIDLNTRLLELDGSLLANRLLWLAIALGTLALTYVRFHFVHHSDNTWWSRLRRRGAARRQTSVETWLVANSPAPVPRGRQSFGLVTHLSQTLAIARASFGHIVKSWSGLLLLVLVTLFALASVDLEQMGVPLLPRTDHVLRSLTIEPEAPPCYLILPMLIVFWSAELFGASEEQDSTRSLMRHPCQNGSSCWASSLDSDGC